MAISILIPDGESHLLIFVVNSLSQIKGVKIYVMSNKRHISLKYSRFVNKVSYYPTEGDEENWIKNINIESSRYNVDVIMPIYEKGIEILIRHKEKILHKHKLGLLPTINDFLKAKNKWLLMEHLVHIKIPHPKSLLLEKWDKGTLKFPFIVKPIEGIGGGKDVSLIQDKTAFNSFLSTNNLSDCKYIIQEYIKGYDIGCSVLCKSGVILAYTIQKASLKADNPFAPFLGFVFVNEEKLYLIISELMKSLNWSGVAHIDARYDTNKNTFKVIEVNTRFWGSLDASLLAGVNFPYLYCLASLNQNFKLPNYKTMNSLNLKGIVKSLKSDIRFVLRFKFILNNTSLKFALNDPIPMVYKYITRTKNILNQRTKSLINLFL